MLDPEAAADYEAWRMGKLVSETDLSIHAYNLEVGAVALAWETGWEARNTDHLITENPYRGKGTTGERKITS